MQLVGNFWSLKVDRQSVARSKAWFLTTAIVLVAAGAICAVLYWRLFWPTVTAAQASAADEGLHVLDISASSPAVRVTVVSHTLPPPIVRAPTQTVVEVHWAAETKPKPDPVSEGNTAVNPVREADRSTETSHPTTPPTSASVGTLPLPLVEVKLESPAIPLARPAAVSSDPPVTTKPPANLQQGGKTNFQKASSAVAIAPALKELQAQTYVPPRPLKWVKPDLQLFGLSKLSESADIKVKVRIDETGRVIAAHALIEGPKHDEKLMAAATAAVRQWIFEPAKAHGTNVPSDDMIVIHVSARTP